MSQKSMAYIGFNGGTGGVSRFAVLGVNLVQFSVFGQNLVLLLVLGNCYSLRFMAVLGHSFWFLALINPFATRRKKRIST